nr:protein BLISTER-like isoform X2 [Ipomoea batatas]
MGWGRWSYAWDLLCASWPVVGYNTTDLGYVWSRVVAMGLCITKEVRNEALEPYEDPSYTMCPICGIRCGQSWSIVVTVWLCMVGDNNKVLRKQEHFESWEKEDSDGAGTSNVVATPASEFSGVDKKYDFKENDITRKTNFGSSNYASVGSTFAANNYDTTLCCLLFQIAVELPVILIMMVLHKTVPRFNEIFPKDLAAVNSSASHTYIGNISPENSASTHVLEKTGLIDRWASGLTSASHKDFLSPVASLTDFSSQVGQKDGALQHNYPVVPDSGYNQFSGSATYMTNTSTPLASDSAYGGFSFDGQSSSNYAQVSPPTTGFGARRSRPSFLDSISISTVSATSPPIETVNTDTFSSKVHPLDNLGSSNSESLMNSSVVSGNGSDMFKYAVAKSMETNHDFYSQKQNEDFAALEQVCFFLSHAAYRRFNTQEKFSLQRSLEASRALAESLAAENSALTDSYNQQAELEAVKVEYANVQLECSAADERSKLLASEALRLRSNELKLERELEKTKAEVSSIKKKIASLEKERQDLQSTVDALQEEKKLLLSKLRKASTGGMFGDTSRTSPNKIDVSTSTEDLDDNEGLTTSVDDPNPGAQTTATSTESSDFPHLLDGGQLRFEGSALTIPPDQIRMIQNINTLISELSLEKAELMKAFSAESSECSKLKELNKELTRKLEAQTQRLELLTAQSMAADNIPVRQPDRPFHENTAYADEGDEVVERVLGWIMKLFPGGPSKRRTSKLL